MEYRYAPAGDYGDYASGVVLRSAPGHPGFPVRLAWELFGRAAALLGREEPLTVWDPACGSGQLLTTVGLRYRDRIGRLLGSDVDPAVLPLARQNLALLSRAGLAARRERIARLLDEHGKESHRSALAAADRMIERAAGLADVEVGVEVANLLDRASLADAAPADGVDVVLTDLPYGSQTDLRGTEDPTAAVETVVTNLTAVAGTGAVVVVVTAGRTLPTTRRPTSTVRVGSRVAGFFAA